MSLDLSLYVTVDTGAPDPYHAELHAQNITHNVTPMWDKAGVYDALYMSDGTEAGKWLDALRNGVSDMRACPTEYEALNSPNGWGLYKNALPFLERWLAACEMHPKATIDVSK